MAYCKNCGSDLGEYEIICTECGYNNGEIDEIVMNQENTNKDTVFIVLGYVFAGLALLIPLLGIVGIVMGVLARKYNPKAGLYVIITSVVMTIIAWVANFLLLLNMY
jgi:uncharacterized membrane protein YvbJ